PVWRASRIAQDPEAVAAAALAHLTGRGGGELDGVWVHLDVDVLDAAVMPAVDSPEPDGIGHEELRTLLRALLADPKCVGMDVGIFDPDLDPDGRYAAELTDTLVAALT
ncbi:MAG TPA: arginase family protein, partial [Kribbella sp.]|nr:arginase family protein [Kribbella sp.]